MKGFCCYVKAMLMRYIHRNKTPTTTAIDQRHTRALNKGRKSCQFFCIPPHDLEFLEKDWLGRGFAATPLAIP